MIVAIILSGCVGHVPPIGLSDPTPHEVPSAEQLMLAFDPGPPIFPSGDAALALEREALAILQRSEDLTASPHVAPEDAEAFRDGISAARAAVRAHDLIWANRIMGQIVGPLWVDARSETWTLVEVREAKAELERDAERLSNMILARTPSASTAAAEGALGLAWNALDRTGVDASTDLQIEVYRLGLTHHFLVIAETNLAISSDERADVSAECATAVVEAVDTALSRIEDSEIGWVRGSLGIARNDQIPAAQRLLTKNHFPGALSQALLAASAHSAWRSQFTPQSTIESITNASFQDAWQEARANTTSVLELRLYLHLARSWASAHEEAHRTGEPLDPASGIIAANFPRFLADAKAVRSNAMNGACAAPLLRDLTEGP